MKQPELGNKITEIRNARAITQKELSEACNIDIRTIQRIEAGEVVPRFSTLKLIAHALDCDIHSFQDGGSNPEPFISPGILITSFVTGIIYLLCWVIFSPIAPGNKLILSAGLYISILYTISGVFFYYLFFLIGRIGKNPLLRISSLLIMIILPLFLITTLTGGNYSFASQINQALVILLGLNSIAFGAGLLKEKGIAGNIFQVTGILQIAIAPFFIIPLPSLHIIGSWLSLPYILLLLAIVFLVYKENRASEEMP